MDLTQIKYFLAVAEKLNFTSAAKSCAVSQPALSKSIRKLEETLGADLFDRTTQRVALTDFGRTMQVHFERIEDSRRKAVDAARIASKAMIERLDVGVMCTIGPHRFGRFLENFRLTHPNIEVTLHDVTTAMIPGLLLSGSLDCVFCAQSKNHDPRFQAIDLFEETLVVAFADGHRLSQFDSVSLAEVAAEPYLDRLHCEFRDHFLDFTKASGLELNVAVRSEREDWILELIRSGMGVAVLPTSSIVLNAVSHRPISDPVAGRKLELVATESAASNPPLAAFREAAQVFDWGLSV